MVRSIFTQLLERLKSRIQWKLIAGTSILLLLVMGISGYGIVVSQRQILKKELEEEGKVFAITLGQGIANALDLRDINRLKQELLSISEKEDGEEVRYAYVYNAEGVVLYRVSCGIHRTDHGKDITRCDEARDAPPSQKLPDLPQEKAPFPRITLRHTEDLLEITNPLFLKERYLGGLRIGISTEEEEEEIEALTRPLTRALILISAITLGFSLILAVLWSKKISKPLIQMTHKTMKFSQGHLEERIEVQTADELGRLATTFNEMAESLSKTLREKETALQAAHTLNQELKKAQIQLIQAERLSAVGLLTSGISHEINNPIGIILTTIGYILEELKPGDPFYEDLKILKEESLRCRKILRDLLTFTSGRETVKEQVDLNQVVEETIILANREKRVRSIHIQQVLCPNLPLVNVDVAQIKQVCLNLILNAADAMPEGGHLVILTGLAEENRKTNVLIQFQDSGRGIAEEDLPRIFEPFFTTKTVGEGFGLGLSVSYGIVKSHGGQIKVTSEVGKGTTFYVYLPVDKEARDQD